MKTQVFEYVRGGMNFIQFRLTLDECDQRCEEKGVEVVEMFGYDIVRSHTMTYAGARARLSECISDSPLRGGYKFHRSWVFDPTAKEA